MTDAITGENEQATNGEVAADADAGEARARAPRATKAATKQVALRYFEAINDRDLDTAVAMWAPGGRELVRGQAAVVAPEGVRAFIGSLLGALPDAHFEIVATTVEGERCALQWRLTGTFIGPEPYAGFEPTGAPLTLEGLDVLTVKDGLIQQNDAFTDGMTFARQAGLMPPQGSAADQRMASAMNARTRLTRRFWRSSEARRVAEGVWVVQGQPARCNVYLLEDGDGLTMFDAGARTMVRQVAAAAARLGGVKRIVLGHGHTDHRGVAPSFDVPILCHPDEVIDAEGSGGFRYWDPQLRGRPFPHRQIELQLHKRAWDGGPVKISGTVSEGDQVAGFEVVHLPGHAPGLIALWRESDRLALTSDAFYVLDTWGRDCAPALPFAAYNWDTEQARASLRKLAALEPASAWPGHAKPLVGEVRAKLERAADRA